MLEGIKKKLIHFKTDGRSIVTDFVSSRTRRARLLRRAVHVCFYLECAAALTCIICGFAMGGAFTGWIITAGALASAGAAFMAVSGDSIICTVSYVLNLVYAVICFIIGGNPLVLCGVVMLVSSAAALIGFAAGYFRGYLLGFSPVKLTPENYTLTGDYVPEPVVMAEPEIPPAPAPQPKSELLLIAEQVAQIMNLPQESAGEERTDEK